MDKAKLKRQLEVHESRELEAYLCPGGHLTIGVGRNLEANPATEELGREIDKVGMKITEEEAEMLLDHDVDRFTAEVRSLIPEFESLSEPRQHVLIDMAFNMGISKLLGFRRMLEAVRTGDFATAADEMLDSAWAEQVKNRADTLASMMREDRSFDALG